MTVSGTRPESHGPSGTITLQVEWDIHLQGITIVMPIKARQVQKGGWGRGARSQGGFGTKIHLTCDRRGRPTAFLLTAGQRNEMLMFEALLDAGKIKRRSRDRSRLRPTHVLADRAYSADMV